MGSAAALSPDKLALSSIYFRASAFFPWPPDPSHICEAPKGSKQVKCRTCSLPKHACVPDRNATKFAAICSRHEEPVPQGLNCYRRTKHACCRCSQACFLGDTTHSRSLFLSGTNPGCRWAEGRVTDGMFSIPRLLISIPCPRIERFRRMLLYENMILS